MNSLVYALKRRALTIFGDIKIFRWPFFLVYHPASFRVKGSHTRRIIETVRPGDVLMRSYVNYLDGFFIPKGESGCSHSGIYIGENKVVHSIAEGSTLDDIIDFCRADKIIVLRPAGGQEWALEHARRCVDDRIPYDFNFEPGPGKYYCHEFTASCYPDLDIQPLSRKVFGLIASPRAFLADSFYTNGNFTPVYPSES